MKKEYSLKGRTAFLEVRRYGKNVKESNIKLVFFKQEQAKSQQTDIKIGIVISRKFGNAVERNKMKRKIKMIITPLLPQIVDSYKIVIIPFPESKNLEFNQLETTFYNLFSRAGILSYED